MRNWKTITALLAAVALAYIAFAPVASTQPTGWLSLVQQDPQGAVQFRAMSAYGQPALIGVGTAAPTAATSSGVPAVNGELYLIRDNAGANEPVMTFYSQASTAWRSLPVSTLVTNAPDIANSIWFEASQIWFEGATGANAFETVLTVADPTVGIDTYQLMDHALAADTYQLLGVPDITQTTGSLVYGEYTDAVAAAAEADDVMIVQRIYIPHAVTVTHVDILNIDIANASAADNTIAVAIYYDADAGAQIVELVGATDDGAGNATGLYTLDIADTILHPGWYRVGFCSQDASDNDIEVHTVQADILALWGGGGAPSEYTSTAAAAPCVAGDPAALTGALTQAAHKVPFVLRVQ